MIALPSIAFGGFSGSAKDVTARHVGGRSILSVRCWPTGPTTNAQVARRVSLSMISRSFKTLTDEQRLRWEQMAEHATGQTVFGQKAKLSGFNLYVRLNSNLVMVGSEMQSDAPVHLDHVPLVRIGVMYVNESGVVINGVEEADDDYRLVVKMSGAQSVGISNGWSKTVVVSSTEETDWGELDLTAAFADVLGTEIANGQKYFVEMYWIDAVSGYSGPVLQFSGIAGTDPIYGDGSGGGSRSIIRVKDYETSDRCYYKDFEYELSRGSVICTVKGEYGYKGTRTNSYIDLTEEQTEQFINQECFLLGRGNYYSQWSINYLHIDIRDYGTKKLQVAPAFTYNTYGALIFDTTAVVTL